MRRVAGHSTRLAAHMRNQVRWLAECALCAVCCLLSLLVVPAMGQDADKPDPKTLAISATIGWNGVVPGDRWAPITVFVTAGERAASGVVTVEFPQDPTQQARITVPFAATPNRTTPVTVVASIPEHCDRMTITLWSEDGRVRRLDYTALASRDTIQLPPIFGDSAAVVLGVGRPSVLDVARDWAGMAGSTTRKPGGEPLVLDSAWGQVIGAAWDPGALPAAATAYEGLAAMVAQGEAAQAADRAGLDAVHEWVLGGGRLVIVLDDPGDIWREWLPEDWRNLVIVDEPGVSATPREIARAIEGLRADLKDPKAARARLSAERRRPRGRSSSDVPTYPGTTTDAAPSSAEEPTEPRAEDPADPSVAALPGAAERVTGRAIHLTDRARALGWKVAWDTEGKAGAGLMAEGPVGFGHVTVLGVEPARCAAVVSTRAAGAVWREALKPGLADFLANVPRNDANNPGWAYWQLGRTQSAINSCLEQLSGVPAVGAWVAVIFGVGLLVLALLVGPVDMIALRRMQRGQHWWVSSLLWISLACAAAYFAPLVIRTSPTQVNRLSVVDHLVIPGGEERPVSMASGITAVFAGEAGMVKAKIDPASWWRGCAAEEYWYGFGRGSQGQGVAPTMQAAAGGATGSRRGNPMQALPMALWTFRAFLDEAKPDVAPPRVRLRETGSGCHLVVTGLPDGCEVEFAEVRIGAGRYAATEPVVNKAGTGSPERLEPVGKMEKGTWEADLPTRPWVDHLWTPVLQATSPQNQWSAYHPATGLSLPGPDRRTLAVSRMVEGGRYGAVLLSVRGWPGDPELARPAKYEHTRLLRLVVPVEGGESGSSP